MRLCMASHVHIKQGLKKGSKTFQNHFTEVHMMEMGVQMLETGFSFLYESKKNTENSFNLFAQIQRKKSRFCNVHFIKIIYFVSSDEAMQQLCVSRRRRWNRESWETEVMKEREGEKYFARDNAHCSDIIATNLLVLRFAWKCLTVAFRAAYLVLHICLIRDDCQ